eukprot:286368_1
MSRKRARGSTELIVSDINMINQIKPAQKIVVNEHKAYDSESEESDISDLETLSDAGGAETDHTDTTDYTDPSEEYDTNKIIQQSIMMQIEQKRLENKETKNIENTQLSQIEIATQKITVCTHTFKFKPYGFSVAPDEFGCNAIVTKVTTKEALNAGLKIGFVVAKIDDQIVIDMPHEIILQFINEAKLPTTLCYADRGAEYDLLFEQKPLGFSIMKDENRRNGRVCRITSLLAQSLGVRIDSYLMAVNGNNCWGLNHNQIINLIKTATLPVRCTFREAPRLKTIIKEHAKQKNYKTNNYNPFSKQIQQIQQMQMQQPIQQ